MDNLVCHECGSEYKMQLNGRKRGPGAVDCQVCGETIFLWVCDENEDYDFELVGIHTEPDETHPS